MRHGRRLVCLHAGNLNATLPQDSCVVGAVVCTRSLSNCVPLRLLCWHTAKAAKHWTSSNILGKPTYLKRTLPNSVFVSFLFTHPHAKTLLLFPPRPLSEFFLIRDTSLIPNILWFEYTVTRAEAR